MKILYGAEKSVTDAMKSLIFEWPRRYEEVIKDRERWIGSKINLEEATFSPVPQCVIESPRKSILWFSEVVPRDPTKFALFPDESLAMEFFNWTNNEKEAIDFIADKGIAYRQWSAWLSEWKIDDDKLSFAILIAQSGIHFEPATIASDSNELSKAKVWADWYLEHLSNLPSIIRDCHSDQLDNNNFWVNKISSL